MSNFTSSTTTNVMKALSKFTKVTRLLYLICTVSFIFASNIVSAQSYLPVRGSSTYLGFGASFGLRTQTIKSDLTNIDQINTVQQGGSIMFTGGSNSLRAKLDAGYYYSAPGTPNTIDLVELGASVNIYPLEIFFEGPKRLAPYVILGFARNNQKFYGYYTKPEYKSTSTTPINYSVSQEPFLGKTAMSQGSAGLGLEYHLNNQYNFVHLFAEVRKSTSFGMQNSALFNLTEFTNTSSINVGVVFGKKY